MNQQAVGALTATPFGGEDLRRERAYWEAYQDLDWVADASKRDAVAQIPRLDGDILELCVGAGTFTQAVPSGYSTYTGVDLSRSLLHALRRRLEVGAVHADAQELPFREEAYDAVLVFSGLHHLPQVPRAIAEAYRVLRPGGCFFCFEPNDRAWYRAPMRFLRHRRRVRQFIGIYSDDETYLDPSATAQILAAHSFRDIRVSYLTPRFRPGYLGAANRVFAQAIYAAAALGSAAGTQSYFGLSARKGPA